MAFGLNL
jgi:hypothetical protein